MSREYKTAMWQRVYGMAMQGHDSDMAVHRRPPADRLFCRGDGPHAERPDIAAGERAHFAEYFARDFAVAMGEVRRERMPV